MHLKENINIEKENNIDLNSFKNELNFLKNDINNNDTTPKDKLIIKAGVYKFGKNQDIGAYFRTIRYKDSINKYAKIYGIPPIYIYSLVTTESKGEPLSFNKNDGGCGILHIQPDTATEELDLKIFTDTEPYKKYAVMEMKKRINKKTNKKRTLAEIYAKHAELLTKIPDNEKPNIDERFNVDKCLNAACKYLKYIRTQYIDNINKGYYKSKTNHHSRDKYKKNEEDFKWKLVLNGFNKGPYNFTRNFENGSHMKNINKYIKDKKVFDKRIKKLTDIGLDNEKILEKLKYPFDKVKIKNGEKGWDYFKYEGILENNDKILMRFDIWDRKQNNKYKNTLIIKDKEGHKYIKAKKHIITQENKIKNETDTTNITAQKTKIETITNKGSFQYIGISKNGNYAIYSYKTEKFISAKDIIKKFGESGGNISNTKITDKDGNKFSDAHKFAQGTKIFLKKRV